MVSLGKNVIANYLGRAWVAILGIALVPTYIHFIGIEAYGLIGFFTTISSVMGLLDLGIGITLNRELAIRSVDEKNKEDQVNLVRTLEIIYWIVSVIAGLAVYLLAPTIGKEWINSQDISREMIVSVIQLMGISIAIQLPMSLYQGGMMGMQKQVLVNILLAVLATIRGGGAVLVLWLISPDIKTFFQWQIAVSAISSLTFFLAIWMILPKTIKKPKFDFVILKSIWRYAAAMSLNALIGVVLSQLDKVILSKLLSLKMFAYYSISTTVASAIWLVIIPFNTAIFPSLAQLKEKKESEELKVFFHKCSQILSSLLFPICAILIFFSSQLLFLWMKDTSVVENCHLLVSLLVFGTMLNGLVSLPANAAPAFGWPLLITYTNIIQSFVIVPLIVFLVYQYQAVGAGIAWIIMNSVFVVFMVPIFFTRYLKAERFKWYIHDTAIPLMASFAVCGLSSILYRNFENKLAIFIWILFTGILAMGITALTTKYVRDLIKLKIVTLIKQ